ncbi:ornithine--oxo-acid transaminase [Acidithiobacillus thiooxidans]|uniref:ornithine--oxo-acid transaminase n=1 Tax=Acidithiobacillus thiooxidans TaxID=930 RepID=UPI0028561A2E|nr:ornithine--oxo-acid transaminase [Acidithiobacillus thiooxidans]MDR7928839.1 ornithine--oxo-acid transaminase [Acidithiobacillus thiooxidans]
MTTNQGRNTESSKFIELAEHYGANNYHPLPIVISQAKGVWVKDPEGTKYMDMLSAYSALNHGHRHARILKALAEQAKRVTLTSRAFNNDQIGPFLKELCEFTDYDMVLPMNTGAEAVETALKAVRKWGYKVKGVQADKAEIICVNNNFHGRTISIVAMSTEPQYKDGFGPFTPGFKVVEYGNLEALKAAINPNTVAFMVEPIQGEAGIIVPPAGYLKASAALCKANNVLFVADEIQTGFGRTGKKFACDYENVKPDMLIMGKALGGGVMPMSAVVASKNVLGVFNPGDHGSTFGGNPLACAVSRMAIKVIVEEKLVEQSYEMGQYFMGLLHSIKGKHIKEVRGKGLLIGVEMDCKARRYCEELMGLGLLVKETHDNVIRFAPPLVITKKEIDWAFMRIKKVLKN